MGACPAAEMLSEDTIRARLPPLRGNTSAADKEHSPETFGFHRTNVIDGRHQRPP